MLYISTLIRIIFLLIEIWFVYIFYSKKSSRSSSSSSKSSRSVVQNCLASATNLAIFQLFRGIHKLISYRNYRLQQSQLKRDDHNTVAPNLKIIITVDQRDSYHQIDRKICRLRFWKPAWHDRNRYQKKYDEKINSEPRHFILKCLCQLREVTGHVYVCLGYLFWHFLQFSIEFWNCSDNVLFFCFPF